MSRLQALNILGLSENATPQDIHNAHKKLVMKYHPDINPDVNTTNQMAQINIAKDVLNKSNDIENNKSSVEDIINRVQEEADEWLADVQKRRVIRDELEAFYDGMISIDDLKYPENIEKAPAIVAGKQKAKIRNEKARARRKKTI